MTRLRTLLPALLLALAPACTGADEPPELRSDLARDTSPDASDADLAALVAGDTAFAADLYQAVRGEPGNLFMSPHSISIALAMTYAGARGDTATQMADTLHFTLPPDRLHAAFNRLDLALASRATAADSDTRPFRLRTASSIWGQEGRPFLPSFLDTLAVNYGAGLHVLDFAADPEAARATINGWVEDRTEGKIVDLLQPDTITGDTRLVLTNAIYFSAAWDNPFDAADTAARPFTLASGARIDVPTLHETAEVRYGEGARFRAVELPYDGDQLSMVVVVPQALDGETGDALPRLEADLTGAKLGEIVGSLGDADVELDLPKFRFDAPLSLGQTLHDLGMVDAFGGDADFSGIDGSRSLMITDVVHKGFVGIDEAGTEAAAATAVILGDSAAPEYHQLSVDRPFLFFIVDRPTGAILFLGRVVDPR